MTRRLQIWFVLLGVFVLIGCQSESPTAPDSHSVETGRNPTESKPQLYPIVDASEQMLFGASRNGEWLTAKKTVELLESRRTYRLHSLTESLGTAVGSGPEPSRETCENPEIHFQDLPQSDHDVMAIGANWNALPRKPVPLNTDQNVYQSALSKHLRDHGIETDEVKLSQVIKVDLEGDGVDEVLLVSNRTSGSSTSAYGGDYAVVLLRKVIDETVRQIPLEEEYYTEDCIAECAPSTYRVSAVLDANGDGVMEIITAFRYFEGRGKRIRVVDGTKVHTVLSWQCGV